MCCDIGCRSKFCKSFPLALKLGLSEVLGNTLGG